MNLSVLHTVLRLCVVDAQFLVSPLSSH